MKRFFVLFVSVLLIFSCSAPKEYTFDNKSVTKKALERKINRYTKKFVKNMNQEQLDIFSGLQVVFDTATHR